MSLSGNGAIAMKSRARLGAGRPAAVPLKARGLIAGIAGVKMTSADAYKRGPFAFDIGITDLLTTLKRHDGQAVYDTVPNSRWLKRKLSDIVELQREISLLEEAAKNASGKSKGFPLGG